MQEENSPDLEEGEEQEVPEGISFMELVSVFFNQGAMSLGAMPHPMTGQVYVSFEAAQESISILELLKEKTRGNLDEQEDRALTALIDELKIAFVHAIRDPRARELAQRTAQASQNEESSRILTPDGRPATSAEAQPRIIIP